MEERTALREKNHQNEVNFQCQPKRQRRKENETERFVLHDLVFHAYTKTLENPMIGRQSYIIQCPMQRQDYHLKYVICCQKLKCPKSFHLTGLRSLCNSQSYCTVQLFCTSNSDAKIASQGDRLEGGQSVVVKKTCKKNRVQAKRGHRCDTNH